MGQQVAGEVTRHLCLAHMDPGHRGLQTLVVVGDHELDAAQPAPGPSQELQKVSASDAPIDAQDLAAALVVDGHSHSHRDRDDASARTFT